MVIRFERAKGRCERCARPHGQIVICFGDGRWWDAECGGWRDGQGRPLRHGPETISLTEIRSTRVYLATAHLDHDPANNRPRNLKALCQRCHIVSIHFGRVCFTLGANWRALRIASIGGI